MNILILSLILYLLIFLFRNKLSFLKYQLLVAFIYLISLSFIQTLDVTLVIYLFFSVVPHLKCFRINSKISILFGLYFSLILFISIINNGLYSSLSVFIIRYIGILFYVYFFVNLDYKKVKYDLISKNDIRKLLILFVFCEVIITLLGYYISGGDSRLMLNYQVTVGNISIVGILFCGYYLHRFDDKTLGFLFSLFFMIIAILSGTRGYIIICISMFFLYLYLYLPKIMKFIVFLSSILIFLFTYEMLIDKFIEITRLGESTGRRLSEDLFVLNYMPINKLNMFFGYGFGTVVSSLQNTTTLIATVSNTQYTNYILPTVNGFHNLYTTIYYSSGIVGFLITVLLLLKINIDILKNVFNKKLLLTLISFVLLYMFVLWYRWTATSGILEFATLAFIIYNYKLEKEDKYEEK